MFNKLRAKNYEKTIKKIALKEENNFFMGVMLNGIKDDMALAILQNKLEIEDYEKLTELIQKIPDVKNSIT